MIKVINGAIELIRSRPQMYVRGEPTGALLASELVYCALVSNATRLQIRVLEAGWVAVGADSDWVTPSVPERHQARSIKELMSIFIPWPEGGPNAIRYEVIVTALSRNVAVKSGERWVPVEGELPSEALREQLAGVEFAVVFQPHETQPV